jgi:repressor of nif and glnA expression
VEDKETHHIAMLPRESFQTGCSVVTALDGVLINEGLPRLDYMLGMLQLNRSSSVGRDLCLLCC